MYEFIEEKLGRTLSPYEYILIDEWAKTYTEDEIKKAFETASINNARTINYVKSVLFSKKPQTTPSWFNKEIKNEPMTQEELKEWNEIMKEFK